MQTFKEFVEELNEKIGDPISKDMERKIAKLKSGNKIIDIDNKKGVVIQNDTKRQVLLIDFKNGRESREYDEIKSIK